jgi:hypothetical protein
MSQSFVNSLGRDYAHENLNGAVFMLDGSPYALEEISDDCDEFTATNLSTGRSRSFDIDLITGWKMFKYPKLGYRSLSPNIAMWCSRNQSYARGLNAGNLRCSYTPLTQSMSYNTNLGDDHDWRTRMRAILLPVFHTKQDVTRLLDGAIPHVVLSEDVLIELPTAGNDDDRWDVYYRCNALGSINSKLAISNSNPANTKIIERILKTYVA